MENEPQTQSAKTEHTCILCSLKIEMPFPDYCPNCAFPLPHLKQGLVALYVFNETGLSPRP